MIRSLALAGIVTSACSIAAAYGAAFLPAGSGAWAPWALAFGTAGILVSVMVLGVTRAGSVGRLAYPLVFVFVVLFGGLAALLGLPETSPTDPTLWLGLPPRAAVLLYVVGILPMFVVPVAYALTFDELTLSESDWQRIRRASPGDAGDESGESGPDDGGDR